MLGCIWVVVALLPFAVAQVNCSAICSSNCSTQQTQKCLSSGCAFAKLQGFDSPITACCQNLNFCGAIMYPLYVSCCDRDATCCSASHLQSSCCPSGTECCANSGCVASCSPPSCCDPKSTFCCSRNGFTNSCCSLTADFCNSGLDACDQCPTGTKLISSRCVGDASLCCR